MINIKMQCTSVHKAIRPAREGEDTEKVYFAETVQLNSEPAQPSEPIFVTGSFSLVINETKLQGKIKPGEKVGLMLEREVGK